MSDNKILIIGAGLGGLALAQALHTAGVPYEIFERDAEPAGRKQGWAIALIEAITSLREFLPEDIANRLPSVSVNQSTGEDDELAFVDAVSGQRIALLGGKPFGQPGSFIRANRETFRSFLWKENNLKVTSNKIFSHYEEDETGVTAYFTDGSSVRGSILIGADGLNSHVLDQLYGEHKPTLSQFVPLFGEIDLPAEQYEPLRKLGNAGLAINGPALRMLIGNLSIDKEHFVSRYYWAVMPRSEHPETLSDWIHHASKQERFDWAMNITKDVHPTLTALLRYGGPSAIAAYQPKFREFVTPENLPARRVTVLGDAAHGMIPFRGAGANTAVQDACDLARLLIEAQRNCNDPSSVIEPYLAKMIPRGREAVLSSRAAGDAAADDPAVYFKSFRAQKEEM